MNSVDLCASVFDWICRATEAGSYVLIPFRSCFDEECQRRNVFADSAVGHMMLIRRVCCVEWRLVAGVPRTNGTVATST